jgi:DnaJ-domain-containing protein 1
VPPHPSGPVAPTRRLPVPPARGARYPRNRPTSRREARFSDVIPAVLAAFQVLQVPPWATADEVKRAYRAKAKQCHPDLHHVDPSRAEEIVRLNEARARLERVVEFDKGE